VTSEDASALFTLRSVCANEIFTITGQPSLYKNQERKKYVDCKMGKTGKCGGPDNEQWRKPS
jgi:hypothetical protein